jgi:hypothetical protein
LTIGNPRNEDPARLDRDAAAPARRHDPRVPQSRPTDFTRQGETMKTRFSPIAAAVATAFVPLLLATPAQATNG